MSMHEGVYSFTNVYTSGNIDLQAGWWYFNDAKDCQAKDGNNPNQQWFVARPPGAAQDVLVIFNLRTGGYVGVWKDEWGRGNHHVKCSPSHLLAANVQWKATQLSCNPTMYLFHWVGDSAKELVCDSTTANVLVRKPNSSDNNGSMHWYPIHLTPIDNTWRDWMDRLPDDIMLTDINLPSTHQTLANHGIGKIRPTMGWGHLGDGQSRPWIKLPQFIDNPRCQDKSLWEQLQLGIRGFDIRLDLDRLPVLKQEPDGSVKGEIKYFLYARHGLAEMGYSWSAVLLTLKVFLQSNPSEFVLMNVRYEKATSNSKDRSHEWMQAFVDETEMFWTESDTVIYKWWEQGTPMMDNMPLGRVHGKVIFIDGGNYMPADSKERRHKNVRFLPEGMRSAGKYDSPRSQWDKQLQDCEDNLHASKADRKRPPTEDDFQRYYQTSFNVSGLPNPLVYKFIIERPLHPNRASRNAADKVFDPIDFFQYFKAKWLARGDDCPLSEENLGKNGQYRLGKVDLDFCDHIQPWVANIIRSNRTKPGREF